MRVSARATCAYVRRQNRSVLTKADLLYDFPESSASALLKRRREEERMCAENSAFTHAGSTPSCDRGAPTDVVMDGCPERGPHLVQSTPMKLLWQWHDHLWTRPPKQGVTLSVTFSAVTAQIEAKPVAYSALETRSGIVYFQLADCCQNPPSFGALLLYSAEAS